MIDLTITQLLSFLLLNRLQIHASYNITTSLSRAHRATSHFYRLEDVMKLLSRPCPPAALCPYSHPPTVPPYILWPLPVFISPASFSDSRPQAVSRTTSPAATDPGEQHIATQLQTHGGARPDLEAADANGASALSTHPHQSCHKEYSDWDTC